MTGLLGGLKYSWLDMQEHERSKKSQDLSEALRRSIANRGLYSAKSKSLS